MAIRNEFEDGSVPAGLDGVYDGILPAAPDQTILVAQTEASTPPVVITIELENGNIARLPADADITNVKANGLNLEFTQPDGSVIVIVGGAINTLILFVGDVQIPAEAVQLMFTSNGIEPAEGPAGGNPDGGHPGFVDPSEQTVGDGPGQNSLLGDTGFSFAGAPGVVEFGNNRIPTFPPGGIFVRLSEEGLDGGNLDSDFAPDDTTNAVQIFRAKFGLVDPEGNDLVYSFTGLPTTALPLTSGGVPVIWEQVDAQHVVGRVNGIDLIDLQIFNDDDSCTITLFGPIDHYDPTSEDALDIVLPIRVADYQNFSDSTLTLTIEDDAPVTTDKTLAGTVQENDLADFNPLYPLVFSFWQGSLGTSPYDGDRSDGYTGLFGTVPAWGDLSPLVRAGADGDGGFTLVAASDADAWITAKGLTSKSSAINDVQAITIPGIGDAMGFFAADGRLIFGLFVSEGGIYNFRLFDQVDHLDTNGAEIALDLSGLVRYSDGDGDTISLATNQFMVTIVDDVPQVVGTECATLDEDDLANFNLLYDIVGPTFWQGSIGTSPFDGFTDNSATGLFGTVTHWGFLGDEIRGGADEFGTFALVSESVATGLLSSLGPTNSTAVTTDDFLYSHGDKITSAEKINILGIGEAMGFFASDGRLVMGLYVDALGIYNVRLFDQIDHLTKNADGDTVLLDEFRVDFGQFVTYTDRDGDKIDLKGHFEVKVVDDAPELRDAVTGEVDEGDLSNFDPLAAGGLLLTPALFLALPGYLSVVGSEGNEQTPSGLLDTILGTASQSGFLNTIIFHNVVAGGADEYGKFEVMSQGDATDLLAHLGPNNGFLFSNGKAITQIEVLDLSFIDPSLGTLMGFFAADGRLVFTLTVTEFGAYDVRLFDQIDHLGAGNDASFALELGQFITYTDFDGDKISLGSAGGNDPDHLVITVVDDTPVLTNARVTSTVEEEQLGAGDLIHGNEDVDDSTGADRDLDTNGNPLSLDSLKTTNITYGSLASLVKIGADENGTFSFALPVNKTVYDADGLAITSRGQAVTFALSGNTLIGIANDDGDGILESGERQVFSVSLLDINPLDLINGANPVTGLNGGNFLFTLLDQIDHNNPNGASTEDIKTINLSGTIKFTDKDGDSIPLGPHSLEIDVIDDTPRQSGISLKGSVEEEHGDPTVPEMNHGNEDYTPDPADGDFQFIGNFPDVTTNRATGDLWSLISVGADEVAKSTFLSLPIYHGKFFIGTGTGPAGLTSKGETVIYTPSDSNNDGVNDTLTAIAGGRPVFTLTLLGTGADAGKYTFTLLDQIDHPNAGEDIKNLDLSSFIRFSDYDGDTITLTPGSFTMDVIDDMPISTNTVASKLVDEDALSTSSVNPGPDLANGNVDSPNHGDETTFTQADLRVTVKSGADEEVTFSLKATLTGAVTLADNANTPVKSNGSGVFWGSDANGLFGYANDSGGAGYDGTDRIVFRLSQATPGSDIVFDLQDAIDHPAKNTNDDETVSLNLTPAFIAKDFDGDAATLATKAIQVSVEDDLPTLVVPNYSQNYVVNGNFSAGFTLAAGNWGPGAGVGDNTTGTGWTIVQTDNDGANILERVGDGFNNMHTTTLQGMVDLEASIGNVEISQVLALTQGQTYKLTFEAGKPDNGSVAGTSVVEVRLGGVLIDTIVSTGQMATYTYNVTVGAGPHTLSFKEIGNPQEGHGTYLANVVLQQTTNMVDEDGLTGGNAGGIGDVVAGLVTSGSLGVVWGADDGSQRDVTFTAGQVAGFTSEGKTVTYQLADSGHTLNAVSSDGRTIFTVTLDKTAPNGAFTFTLKDNIDHASGGDENDTTLTFGFTAKDSDGDPIPGSFQVAVDDDSPILTGGVQSAAVYENELPAGTAFGSSSDLNGDGGGNDTRFTGNLTSLVSFGADKPGSFIVETTALAPALLALTSGGTPLTYSIGVDNMLIAKAGTVEIFNFQVDPVTGQYSFRLSGPLDHVSGNGTTIVLDMSSAVTARDFDGDTTALHDQISITINDDTPLAPAAAVNLIQNGDFITGGWSSPAWWGSVANPGTVPGWTIAGDPSDMPSTLYFERQLNGFEGLNSSTGNGMIDLGGSPGNYQLSQNVAAAQDGQVYSIEFEVGAPFPQTALMQVWWGNQLLGTIDTTVDQGLLQKFTYLVTGSGTPANNTLIFKEIGTGDAPLGGSNATERSHGTYIANVKMFAVNAVVDEDALNNSSAHGIGDTTQPGDDPGTTIATGTLGILWGADNRDAATSAVQDAPSAFDRSLTFTDATVTLGGVSALTSGGHAVVFALTDNNTRLVGYVDGGSPGFSETDHKVFEVTLNDDLTGSFNFTLFDNLDHAPGGNENDIRLEFGYTAKDADGDTTIGKFAVGIDDDAPVVTAAIGQAQTIAEPTTFAIGNGNLNVAFGADGEGAHVQFASTVIKDNLGNVLNLTSGGEQLNLVVTTDVNGDQTLTAFLASQNPATAWPPVFYVQLHANQPTYDFAFFGPLDHFAPNGASLPLTFSVKAIDGDGDSVDQTFTINVTDDVPVAVKDDAVVFNEDTGVHGGNVMTNDIQGADGATLTKVTFDDGANWSPVAASGVTTIVLAGEGTYTFAPDGTWTFLPELNFNGTAGFAYIITDFDGDESDPDVTINNNVVINVTADNDAPVLSGLDGLNIGENTVNTIYRIVDISGVTLTDPDSADFGGGNITVTYSSGGSPEDQLIVRPENGGGGPVTISGSDIFYNGVLVASSSGGNNGTTLVVSLNASATLAVVEALIEHLAYGNTSDTPLASRTISVTVNDGDGGTSLAQTAVINVTPENDAPVAINDTLVSGGVIPDLTGWSLNEDNGHYYKVVSAIPGPGLSWTDAMAAASNAGGYLATVTSAAENSFINGLMPYATYYWLGATDSETEGLWKWVTGPEAGTAFWTQSDPFNPLTGAPISGAFSPWLSGEPNNGYVGNDEDYLLAYKDAGWNDGTNDGIPFGYVIEFGGSTFNPQEDTPFTIEAGVLLANDTDVDGDTLTIVSVQAPVNGGVSMIGTTITFTPNANYFGPASFTYTVDDGHGGMSTATVNVTVAAVNDAPVISGLDGATFLENTVNATPQIIDADVTLTDIDSANFDTGELTVSFSSGGSSQDQLSILNQGTGAGQIGVSGSTVSYGGVNFGTISGGVNGTDLVVTFNSAAATQAAVEALIERLAYRNTSDTPANSRTISIVVNDGDAGMATSTAQTTTIIVTQEADTTTKNIGFENLGANISPIPSLYSGFLWHTYGVDYYGSIQNTVPYTNDGSSDPNSEQFPHAGLVSIFNPYGTMATEIVRGDGSDFDFTSVWMKSVAISSGAFAVDVLIEGIDNGVVVYSQLVELGNSSYTLISANYLSIDMLRIVAVPETTNSNPSGWWAADDFVFEVSGVDPIILDLDGDGFRFPTQVQFDMDGDGGAGIVSWPGAGDGILVADLDHSGAIESGNEVFSPEFGEGGHNDSLAALATYDTNGDGKITAEDAGFGDLKVWQDFDGDGVTDDGELSGLSDLGIVEIDLGADEVDWSEDGQHVFAAGSYTTSDGASHDYIGVDLGAPFAATQTGTSAADVFSVGPDAVEFIADYDFDGGDKVDLSTLLGDVSAEDVASYVKLEGDTLKVDVDGAGTGHDFQDVASFGTTTSQLTVTIDTGFDVIIDKI